MNNKPITPEMRLFLLELADLVEKHGVTLCAGENDKYEHPLAHGVHFEQREPYSWAQIGTSTYDINDRDLREFANKH